jgi:hypothetical protein
MPAGWTSGPSRQRRRQSRRGEAPAQDSQSTASTKSRGAASSRPGSWCSPASCLGPSARRARSARGSAPAGAGKPTPEQMAKVPGFLGDGEVTSFDRRSAARVSAALGRQLRSGHQHRRRRADAGRGTGQAAACSRRISVHRGSVQFARGRRRARLRTVYLVAARRQVGAEVRQPGVRAAPRRPSRA